MGKRNRGGASGQNQQNELSSTSLNAIPCSSGTELLSRELDDANDVKPLSPGMDVADSTLEQLHMHTSLENQHNDIGRSFLSNRSQHHFGNRYARRNSGSHASASSSHRRPALLSDAGIRASASTSHGRTAILRDSDDNSASTSLGRTVLSSDQGVRVSASTSHGRTSHLLDSGNHASASSFLGRNAFLRGKDDMQCSSGTELLSGKLDDASNVKPISSGMDVADSTLEQLHMHPSLENQHNDLGRSFLLNRSRHHFGNRYARRNSGSHASALTSDRRPALLSDPGIRVNASTSHGRTSILHGSGDNSASRSLGRTFLSSDPGVRVSASTSHGRTSHLLDSGNHARASFPRRSAFLRGKDNRETQFRRPGNARFGAWIRSSASTDESEMVCGICDKLPRRKLYFPGKTRRSSSLLSVVAVLACGHVYHADCLEKRTSVQEIRDPPCPQCMGYSLLSRSR